MCPCIVETHVVFPNSLFSDVTLAAWNRISWGYLQQSPITTNQGLFTSLILRKLKVKVTQLCPTLCDYMDILQARILEWVAFPFFRGSPQPRDQTQVFCIAGGFFTSWATREAKNTGVGRLSLLQRIFPTQELNLGLLYCKRLLYQLNYQGSPESQ